MSKSTPKTRSKINAKSLWSKAIKNTRPGLVVVTEDEGTQETVDTIIFNAAAQGLRGVLLHQQKTMGPAHEKGKVGAHGRPSSTPFSNRRKANQ